MCSKLLDQDGALLIMLTYKQIQPCHFHHTYETLTACYKYYRTESVLLFWVLSYILLFRGQPLILHSFQCFLFVKHVNHCFYSLQSKRVQATA